MDKTNTTTTIISHLLSLRKEAVESMWKKRNFTVRNEQQDRNKVRISREGGRVKREQESVFAQGSVGDDKTEAS